MRSIRVGRKGLHRDRRGFTSDYTAVEATKRIGRQRFECFAWICVFDGSFSCLPGMVSIQTHEECGICPIMLSTEDRLNRAIAA